MRRRSVPVSVSAALITRDEEHHLGDCLASIVDLVDEIVVVDTGSTDGTVEIARAHGARVDEIVWPEDFSAARNHALAMCGGTWVLYVDADERVRPLDPQLLRRELSSRRLVGATVALHPRTGHTAYRELRLFLADPRLRFRGIIHETIWPAVQELCATRGGRVGTSSLVIDHVGYDGAQVHKHARNLPLLLRALDADPDSVYCWYHLGTTLRDTGDPDGARDAWRRGIDVLRRRGPSRPADSLPFIELIQADLAAGHDVDGLLGEARTLFPRDPVLRWQQAQAALAAGRLAEAAEGFEALLVDARRGALTDDLGFPTAMFGARTHAMAATAYLELGDHAAAARHFARAEATEPDNLEYRAKRILAEHLAS